MIGLDYVIWPVFLSELLLEGVICGVVIIERLKAQEGLALRKPFIEKKEIVSYPRYRQSVCVQDVQFRIRQLLPCGGEFFVRVNRDTEKLLEQVLIKTKLIGLGYCDPVAFLLRLAPREIVRLHPDNGLP